MSTLIYKLGIESKGLTFKNAAGTKIKDGSEQLVLTNGSNVSVGFDSRAYTLSLYGLSHVRKMYEPGRIQAEVLVTVTVSKSELMTVATIRNMFLKRGVTLKVLDGSKSYTVAEKYYIHSITPRFTSTTSGDNLVYQIYTKLDIYSPDKRFTLNKFSCAYVGKRLQADIIGKALDNYSVAYTYPDEKATDVQSTPLKITLATDRKLIHLGYTDTTSSALVELYHPYLVQYNESFYDFIKRVANRCGEALYFENGTLCCGLPYDTKNKKLKDPTTVTGAQIIYCDISGSQLPVTNYARDSVKDTGVPDTNTTEIERGSDDFPTDAFADSSAKFVYNSEVAADDHYIVLYKDKFALRGDPGLYDDPDAKGMEFLLHSLNSKSLWEMVIDYATAVVRSASKYGVNQAKIQDQGNEYVRTHAINNNSYATLYAPVDNSTSHWITKSYYDDIGSKQETLMQEMVCLDFQEEYNDVRLGDIIKLSDSEDDTTQYVVIQVELANNVQWTSNYNGFFQGGGEKGTGGTQYLRVYAIPMTSDNVFYPPVVAGELFRRCGPQTAFVTDNEDPKAQGRVRVRFGWQPQITLTAVTKDDVSEKESAMENAKSDLEKYATGVSYYPNNDGTDNVTVIATSKSGADASKFRASKGKYETACKEYEIKLREYNNYKKKYLDDSSPWIRVVTPLATQSGGGMFFQPEIGDEVMVDFQNGNADIPFVSGMLFSKNALQPKDGNRIIVSRNGHTIRFWDPDDESLFVGGTYPGLKFLQSYGLDCDTHATKGRKAVGGIDMYDKLGFYHISMSSHERNITISSAFGDININALTGISIYAPNGDIKIEGKNVDITAQNKLTLTSGENIDRLLYDHRSGVSKGAQWLELTGNALANEIVQFIDLSFLRTLLEIVIRPVDGTLLIKSKRYLLLEAGEGKASVAMDQYETDSVWKAFETNALDEENSKQQRRNYYANSVVSRLCNSLQHVIPLELSAYIGAFISKFNTVVRLFNSLSDPVNMFFTPTGSSQPLFVIDGKNSPLEYWKELFSTLKPNDAEYVSLDNYIDTKLGANGENIHFKATIPQSFSTAPAIATIKTAGKAVADLNYKVGNYDDLFAYNVSRFVDAATQNSMKNLVQTAYPMMPIPSGGAPADSSDVLYTWIKKVIAMSTAPDAATFSAELVAANFENWRKSILRRVAYTIIEYNRPKAGVAAKQLGVSRLVFAAAQYNVVPDPIRQGVNLDPSPLDTANPFSDSDWARYVAAVKFDTLPDNQPRDNDVLQGAFAKGFADPFYKKVLHWAEWTVWNDMAQGEIVFSNKKDVSYRFNRNGAPEKYVAKVTGRTEELSDSLKDVLIQL